MKRSLRIEVVPSVLLAEGALRAEDDARGVVLEPESARHQTQTECRLAWHGFRNMIDLAFTEITKIIIYLVQNSRSILFDWAWAICTVVVRYRDTKPRLNCSEPYDCFL
jgi:hypothetical protein